MYLFTQCWYSMDAMLESSDICAGLSISPCRDFKALSPALTMNRCNSLLVRIRLESSFLHHDESSLETWNTKQNYVYLPLSLLGFR